MLRTLSNLLISFQSMGTRSEEMVGLHVNMRPQKTAKKVKSKALAGCLVSKLFSRHTLRDNLNSKRMIKYKMRDFV